MLDPVTIERMEAAADGGPIIVALSGGGDSTALLHLLKVRFGARLRAVVVDHALREGAADDAKRAQTQAHTIGVSAQVVKLSWPSGANRSQQGARQKRYAAICAAAREQGARLIALGHTADDQAETVFMRAAGGSAWRGLAGMAPMAPAPLWPEGRGIALARPLLEARREDLRAFLRDRDVDWIDDPANANTAYERIRVRRRLRDLAAVGVEPMRLARLAKSLRVHAEAIDAAASDLIARVAWFEADRIFITRPLWAGPGRPLWAGPGRPLWAGQREVRRRALSVLVAAAAGAQREPPAEALARLEEKLTDPAFRGATLAGARVQIEGGALLLDRDRGALEGRAGGAAPLAPLLLPGGVETVWDGRLLLHASADGVTVYAVSPAPRLSISEHNPPIAVTSRWLLADRVAHALNLNAPLSIRPWADQAAGVHRPKRD